MTGATWTPPTSTGIPGQATYPVPLPDGRLVIFQQRRGETQVMVALVSDDGGRTFDRSTETVIYQHASPSASGADGSLTAFDYLMSMDQIHVRPPVRGRHRPGRGARGLVRRRPDPDEHPRRRDCGCPDARASVEAQDAVRSGAAVP